MNWIKTFEELPSKYLVSLQSILLFISWREAFNDTLRIIASCVGIAVGIFTLIYYHYRIKLAKEQIETTKQDRARKAEEREKLKDESE